MDIRSGDIAATMMAMANMMIGAANIMADVARGSVDSIASVWVAWVSYCYRYCCRHHGCYKYLMITHTLYYLQSSTPNVLN